MAQVALTNVKKSFGAVDVIPNLNLKIDKGSFTVLVGPSGCGKSTLLRMLAGLEEVTEGTVEIAGKDITDKEPSDRGIAMVFQSYALYPHMTVAENIGFNLKLQKHSKEEIDSAVRSATKILRLEEYLNRKPGELSGGQRQRVAIGRAIVRNPNVFLFDEPLSNLDAAHRADMRVELSELHSRLGSTSVYVTHDQVEAMTMADQIVVMNAGQIEQTGSPNDVYYQPATPFVAQFIGAPKMNFLEGNIAKEYGCELLGIRPENLALSSEQGDWKCRITHVENLGSECLIYTTSDLLGKVVVRTEGIQNFSEKWQDGQEVYLTADKKALHKFVAGKRVEEAA